jgi:hypothetical protein
MSKIEDARLKGEETRLRNLTKKQTTKTLDEREQRDFRRLTAKKAETTVPPRAAG